MIDKGKYKNCLEKYFYYSIELYLDLIWMVADESSWTNECLIYDSNTPGLPVSRVTICSGLPLMVLFYAYCPV